MDSTTTSVWTQKCSCGKLFHQPNAYSNHINSCTVYKKRLNSTLESAKARWEGRSSQRNAKARQVDAADMDLDVDYLPLSNQHPLLDPTPNGPDLLHEEPRGRGLRQREPTQRYQDFVSTSDEVPANIPMYGRAVSTPPSSPTRGQSVQVVQPSLGEAVRLTVRNTSTWKKTSSDAFGVYKRYWTVEASPHDPDFYASGHRSQKKPMQGAAVILPEDTNPLYPFPNMSSFLLGEWFWAENEGKSRESFRKLIAILTSDDFDSQSLRLANWDKINDRLAASEFDRGSSEGLWHEDGTSWTTSSISIQVPFNTTTLSPGLHSYTVKGFRYRPLLPSIVAKLQKVTHDEGFHIVPSELWWHSNLNSEDVRVHSELYHSQAFIEQYTQVQSLQLDGLKDPDLPRYIVGLMFASDKTTLTSYGDSTIWPAYMFFGNDTKLRRGKVSLDLFEEVAYFQTLPDEFADWYTQLSGKNKVGTTLRSHLNRELFHAQWEVLLDNDFMEAYCHGVVVECLDGVSRRFFPRMLTYSSDYPEKITIVGVRHNGDHPCPRCLVHTNEISELGTPNDRAIREFRERKDDADQRKMLDEVRKYIHSRHVNVNAAPVEKVLKPLSLVPAKNVFSDCLSTLGLELYNLPAVDILHEFESGIWQDLFVQLLRLLEATDVILIAHLNARFRQMPTFGVDTIRRFGRNVSGMKQFAAHDYEDILQCAIPAFEGLFPSEHDANVQNILYTMAHWHSLAKMRMHTDQTLSILDTWTTILGNEARTFVNGTCAEIETFELQKEYERRKRREASKQQRQVKAQAQKQSGGSSGPPLEGKKFGTEAPERGKTQKKRSALQSPKPSSLGGQFSGRIIDSDAGGEEISGDTDKEGASTGTGGKKLRTWSLETPKFHLLGHVVPYIRRFGTTDSYSTQFSERLHRYPKSRYKRTNKKNVPHQLSQIQMRQARIKQLRKKLKAQIVSGTGSKKTADLGGRYIIGTSQNMPVRLYDLLRLNANDYAIKDFIPRLKRHLFPRLVQALLNEAKLCIEEHALCLPILEGLSKYFMEQDLDNFFIHSDRIFRHNTLQVNYDSYDCVQERDILNPSTSRRDFMCLSNTVTPRRPDNGHIYLIGRILGIFHVNLVYHGPGMLDNKKRRFDFVWVRWFNPVVPPYPWDTKRLDRVRLAPISNPNSCGFIDPSTILRAAHIVPRFSLGKRYEENELNDTNKIFSKLGQDRLDWTEYYVNRFVDRDMTMRYHWGLAVGHQGVYAQVPLAPTEQAERPCDPMEVDAPSPSSFMRNDQPQDEETTSSLGESDDSSSTDGTGAGAGASSCSEFGEQDTDSSEASDEEAATLYVE